jgi:hypothetical protein
MATPASSLPDRWIQHIWTTMRANYGARWDRMFPVPPCPPDVDPTQHVQAHTHAIQRVWAAKLGLFQFNSKRLTYGLDNLPTDPPNLPEFYALCNRSPSKNETLALNAPTTDPERVRDALSRISVKANTEDNLAWARRLHTADLHDGTFNGRYITLAQRQTYRQALRLDRFGATE